jgi:hypothetical protein
MLARVAPTNGYYAVYSGEVTPLPADLFDGGDRWLEVEVGAPLAPRQYIGSVAHAITCKNVSGGAVNAVNIQLNGKPVVAGSIMPIPPPRPRSWLKIRPPSSSPSCNREHSPGGLARSKCCISNSAREAANPGACRSSLPPRTSRVQ